MRHAQASSWVSTSPPKPYVVNPKPREATAFTPEAMQGLLIYAIRDCVAKGFNPRSGRLTAWQSSRSTRRFLNFPPKATTLFRRQLHPFPMTANDLRRAGHQPHCPNQGRIVTATRARPTRLIAGNRGMKQRRSGSPCSMSSSPALRIRGSMGSPLVCVGSVPSEEHVAELVLCYKRLLRGHRRASDLRDGLTLQSGALQFQANRRASSLYARVLKMVGYSVIAVCRK